MAFRPRNAFSILLISGALLAGTSLLAQKKNTPSPVGPNGPVGPNRPVFTPPLTATPLTNVFTGPMPVVSVSSPTSQVYDPHEAVDGNNVYAVWRSAALPSGPYGISISVSHDGGHTFSPPQLIVTGDAPISGSTTAIWGPDVAAGGGHVWVSYFIGGALKVVESQDGVTFSAPREISHTADPINARLESLYQYHRMASLPGSACIVWGESTHPTEKGDKGKFDTNPIIKFLRLVPTTDWKTTAVVGYQTTTPQPVTVSRLGVHATTPSLCVDASEVRVVFLEQQGTNSVVAIAQSNDGGINFDTIANATEARTPLVPSYVHGAEIGDIAKPVVVISPSPYPMPPGCSPVTFGMIGGQEFLSFERLALPAVQLVSSGSGGFFRNPSLGVSWAHMEAPSIVSFSGVPRLFWSTANLLETAGLSPTAGLVSPRSLAGSWQGVEGYSLNSNALLVDQTHLAVFGRAGLSPTVPIPFATVSPYQRQFLSAGNHQVAFWTDTLAVDQSSPANPLRSMVIGP